MAEALLDLELCPNCKKEIPQCNYIMHTMHCARNISICTVCKEPVAKAEMSKHLDKHQQQPKKKVESDIDKPIGWKTRSPLPYSLPEKLGHVGPADYTPKAEVRPKIRPLPNAKQLPNANQQQQIIKQSQSVQPMQNGKPSPKLSACRYCELELPVGDLAEHEDYCGTRTDKCIECGEFVMFKYKKLHEESNHGFLKLNDEPAPRPNWDSSTSRSAWRDEPSARRTNLPSSTFNMSPLYNVVDYLPSSYVPEARSSQQTVQEKEEYKKMSRRLDSKTEYIKNLLHDSACITAPLRSTATAPRNHFNHNKGPAPRPPRRMPPTELTVPCEFCDTPIPHEELILHETGCRPDLARYNPSQRRMRADEDDYSYAQDMPAPSSPEVQLPCEFCADLIPASQLLRHQATCN